MIMVCKICKETYNEKHPSHKGGHYAVCGDCEDKTDVNRSVGFWDVSGKSDYKMEIIINPNDAELDMVKRMGHCGPSHCHTSLGLSTNGTNTPKANMDKVHANLYGEK
jgi:hypothetical protein